MINKVDRNAERLRRHRRVRAKISGTSQAPRLCVYRSNKNIEVQVIDDTKGITLCSSSSESLKLEHGNNIEAAKLVGADIAKKAKNATLWTKTSCADFRIAFAFSYINAQNYGYY